MSCQSAEHEDQKEEADLRRQLTSKHGEKAKSALEVEVEELRQRSRDWNPDDSKEKADIVTLMKRIGELEAERARLDRERAQWHSQRLQLSARDATLKGDAQQVQIRAEQAEAEVRRLEKSLSKAMAAIPTDVNEDAAHRPPHAESGVRKFFAGKSVFVTGGSGLVGKVLIEKILRDCPDVGHIYVLLRSSKKRQLDADQRLQKEILDSPCFDHLRKIWPAFRSHCTSVQGDMGLPRLGMRATDYEMVCARCSVVFHCAATVKFNEHLETAFRINVDGVGALFELCSSMRSMHVLVHVSTAFVSAPDHSNQLSREALCRLTFDHQLLRKQVVQMKHAQMFGETALLHY